MVMNEDAQKDGGQAFPASGNHGQHVPGMTLRDWFAGMAMQTLIDHTSLPALAARDSYAYAAAMLNERSKQVSE